MGKKRLSAALKARVIWVVTGAAIKRRYPAQYLTTLLIQPFQEGPFSAQVKLHTLGIVHWYR